jgi:hypothetical protein
MKQTLKKLGRTSFDEFRTRSAQALAAFSERHRWPARGLQPDQIPLPRLTRINSFAELLTGFRKRDTPHFFGAFADPEGTVREFSRRWPRDRRLIIEQAERVLLGQFDLLGLKRISFGDPVDWHFEPIANKRTPLLHWSRLNYLDANLAGDKKIVWELNRHQFFVTLGQAYWFTGEERFAHAFCSLITSWMDQNPPKLGINWASSLEISLRAISWTWALHFFRYANALTPELFTRIAKHLHLSARHIETYLSTYFSPNTHLTGEALGLFYLGTLFPEFHEASRWQNTGENILIEQLQKHVKPDGVYFEQSSYYHRYTTDFYLHFLILLEANAKSIPSLLRDKLILLLDHLMYLTRPDGTTPFVGDDDGGRLVKLDQNPADDFRSTLATGAVLFNRSDYKFVANNAATEALWLLGPAGIGSWDGLCARQPEQTSKEFAESGFYVMRDGWAPDSNYLLFDCGSHGTANCGHAHADALGFDLVVKGRRMLIDPGTYTYTGSSQMRDWFRSSAAHNTVTIDGESSSVAAGPFSWQTIADAAARNWISEKRFDYLVAEQSGFMRSPWRALHRRGVLFLKNDYWVMRDSLTAQGKHQVQLWFHFDSGTAPLSGRDGQIQMISENERATRFQLNVFGHGGEWSKQDGWVSHCYGSLEVAPVFTFSIPADNTKDDVITFLLPTSAEGGARTMVREVEAIGGRAFEIAFNGKHDLLLLRGTLADKSHGQMETVRATSDFEVSWIRFSSVRSREPEEMILLGGETLTIDGLSLIQSSKALQWISAKRVGDQLQFEMDDTVSPGE